MALQVVVGVAAFVVLVVCLERLMSWLFGSLNNSGKDAPRLTRRERKFGRYTTTSERHRRERGWHK